MNKGVIWYVPTIYSILYLLPFTWKLTADFYPTTNFCPTLSYSSRKCNYLACHFSNICCFSRDWQSTDYWQNGNRVFFTDNSCAMDSDYSYSGFSFSIYLSESEVLVRENVNYLQFFDIN